jgi:DNA-binding transcriptional LysR family regulator
MWFSSIAYLLTTTVIEELMVDWQDILFLMTLAESKSLSAAAEKLDVNRTTVSRRIESLEKFFSTKLVERIGRNLVLTEAGCEVVMSAEIMNGEVQSLRRRVSGNDEEIAGVIRFTTTPAIARMLSRRMAEFGAAHPQVFLEISATNVQEDMQLLEADIALRLTKSPPEELVGRKMFDISTALYASLPTNKKLQQKLPVTYISSSLGSEVSKFARDILEARQGTLRTVLRSNSMDLVKEMLHQGDCVALLPCYLAEGEADLMRVPDTPSLLSTQMWLLYHPRGRKLHRVQAFIQVIESALEEHRSLFEAT